ncbi:MAG: SHOCT domain-containing protein [Dermatophilaceae bacterium]|jgi:hypothetical protein|nr:SHOCT domain-containing protein [Dermatophilaceae bacterium]
MMNWSTGWNGGGWAAMSLMTLFWAALIGLAIWAAVRLMAPRGSGTHPVATPRATLDARLASGAIDAEEYARLRRLLEGSAPGTVVGDTPTRS